MPKASRKEPQSKSHTIKSVECRWCHKMRSPRGMPLHERRCAENPQTAAPHRTGPEESTSDDAALIVTPAMRDVPMSGNDGDAMDIEQVEPQAHSSSSPVPAGEDVPPSTPPEQSSEPDSSGDVLDYGPHLPREYILTEFHPNSERPAEIVSLDSDAPQPSLARSSSQPPAAAFPDAPTAAPWAPFASEADFDFAEAMVIAQMSSSNVNMILRRLHGSWSTSGSNVSFRTYEDMARALNAARCFATDFRRGSVTVPYKGLLIEHRFWYRSPWEWISRMASDSNLSKTHIWHATRKYYCRRDSEERIRLIDETNTADRWWRIETALGKGHFLLPMHLWLDEGKVSNKVKMHPIVGRALFQPSQIRNASGNGGGMLLGFMEQVKDPFNPNVEYPNASKPDDFALYERNVYNAILGYMFDDCALPSHIGRLLECGDDRNRVVHPDLLVGCFDGLEAGYFCAVRGPTAYHPYPTCLVHKSNLSKLTCTAPKRTVETMRQAYGDAMLAAPRQRQDILAENGIHLIEHFLWKFRHSDPYAAYAYDLLHSDDLGKNGHHLWPLLRKWLKENGHAAAVNRNASLVPPWPGLERFSLSSKPICNIDFSDGETFFCIAKIIVPCIVQVMPRNSSLVQCFSYYTAYRFLMGMTCSSDVQRAHLKTVIEKYEYWCSRVSADYGKSFDFFKQHAAAHGIDSIEDMGATPNQSTRPGEGFIQEVKQQYHRTNGRDVEKQMTTQDAWGEVIAQIRTAVDMVTATKDSVAADSQESAPSREDAGTDNSHMRVSFGAPIGRWEDARSVEAQLLTLDDAFRGLDAKLRKFIADTLPHLKAELRGNIRLKSHECCYINFSSEEDFRAARNIVRCTASWYGAPRYDCVLYDDEQGSNNTYKPVRLRRLFKCKMMTSGDVFDVVAVSHFASSSWKPKTQYRGCRVFTERTSVEFALPEQLIRGAVMIPAFGAKNPATYYLHDTASDGDLFLRLNSLCITL